MRIAPCIHLALGLLVTWPWAAALGNAQLSLSGWTPVQDAQLDALRGGLQRRDGLHVSLGIVRETHVNGQLAAHTRAVVQDIGAMTAPQAQALQQALNEGQVVQIGPDNVLEALPLAPGVTVIQNTLDNQHIVTTTTLNTGVNTLAWFRSLNLHESLQHALGRQAGVR